jgi:hypothetical protein
METGKAAVTREDIQYGDHGVPAAKQVNQAPLRYRIRTALRGPLDVSDLGGTYPVVNLLCFCEVRFG